MYCRKCGAPLPEDAIYCGNCGEKIINGCAIKKTQSNKMYIIIVVLFLVITTIGYIFTIKQRLVKTNPYIYFIHYSFKLLVIFNITNNISN